MNTKTFEKIHFIRFYWISNTKARFTDLKIQKLITVGSGWRGGGSAFFPKKISGGVFIRDLRVAP